LSVQRYDAAAIPCVDGAYFTLFQREVLSHGGKIVDMLPQAGAAKTLRMSRMSAHELVQTLVGVSIAKHGISHIIIGGHLCCGAYEHFRLSLPEEEALQRQHMARARHFLQEQVALAIKHYLAYEEGLADNHRANLQMVLDEGLNVAALIIKPHNMVERITDPPSQCFVEKVF